MLKKQRHEAIVDYLEKHRYARVDELAQLLKTSEITIRRDINELNDDGKLRKVYGGAETLDIVKEDVSYINRSIKSLPEKQIIAKKASEYLRANLNVYLDAGSTTHCLIPFLKNLNLTVFTHGIHHVEALSKLGIKTHLVGGSIKEDTLAAVGSSTIMYLSQFRFDIAFMGSNAVDMKMGFMTPDVNEAMVKRKIIDQSDEVYILADSSKFNRTSNVVFADKEIPVITNKKILNSYKDFDIRV